MKETFVYKQVDGCKIRANIYYVDKSDPVLVYYHSGGLMFGARSMIPAKQIEFFNQSGFTVISVDYRLAPESKLPDIADDVRDALVWVKTHAMDWLGADPDKLAVVGASAGGYLSLLAGTMGEVRPKAVVSLYGYGDLTGDWCHRPSEYYNGRPPVDGDKLRMSMGSRVISESSFDRLPYYIYCRQQGRWAEEISGLPLTSGRNALKRYSPLHLLSGDYPPTLLLHGTADGDVPYEQSVLMHQGLQAYGIATRLITMEGAGHVFDEHFEQPMVQEAFGQIIAFLRNAVLNQ